MLFQELMNMLPDDVKALDKVDRKHSERIKAMFKLMTDDKFPMMLDSSGPRV